MKKIMNKVSFAIISVMASSPAFAEVDESAICKLVEEFRSVFSLLQTLAFIGAGFMIAGWAWGYISSGKAEIKDLKEKGTGLLVGFILLFGVGLLLGFITSASGGSVLGCVENAFN